MKNKIKYLFGTVMAMTLVYGRVDAQTNTNLQQFANATNIVAIPYIGYDLQTHKVGYGGVILRGVTPNFYAGLRAETFAGQTTTAGVQGQLQVSGTIAGINYTPFLEASTGLGKSSLYANAGPGVFINFHTWILKNNAEFSIGAIGDYEHYVNGNAHGDRVNGGLYFDFNW